MKHQNLRRRSNAPLRKTAAHVTSSKNCDSKNGSENNKNNGVYMQHFIKLNVKYIKIHIYYYLINIL